MWKNRKGGDRVVRVSIDTLFIQHVYWTACILF